MSGLKADYMFLRHPSDDDKDLRQRITTWIAEQGGYIWLNETVRTVTMDNVPDGWRCGVVLEHFDGAAKLIAVEYLASKTRAGAGR